MSFSFLGAADLQWRVSFNMGLGFKKWNKLPQAKFWLEKAQQLSGGKDPKTARQLIGLEEIVAEAGIGKNSGSTAKNSKGISGTKAVPSTATPMKTFSSEPSSKTADDDMGFLQEETVGSGFSQKSTANAQSDSAIQALMQDIDNIVDLEKDFAEVFDVDITIPPSKIL